MVDITVSVPSLLIPVHGKTLILPNAAVAEIVDYRDPEAVEGGPDWLLGSISWRGKQLPVIACEAVMGGELPPAQGAQRIAVVNTLNENPDLPFFALVLQGIPQLVGAVEAVVAAAADDAAAPPTGVLTEVTVNGQPALIPDLDALERMISEAYRR